MTPASVEAPPSPSPAPEPPALAAEPVGGPGLVLRGLHLAVLSALGIAQPLFTEIDEGSQLIFFDHERIDIVLLTLAVTLGPPAVLLAVEALASVVSRRLGYALHLIFVAGLAFVFASQLIGPTGRVQAIAALAAGAGFAALYAKAAPARSILTVLAPVPLLFAALFLFFSPVERLAVAGDGDPPANPVTLESPVVMIVLDEMPATALMDARGELDAVRYPNFARLAERSTWFRNATTRHSFTEFAVPAIATGKRSEEDSLPVASDHPENLFAMLSGGPVAAEEPVTGLCPGYVCPNARSAPRRTASLLKDMAILSMRQWLPASLAGRLPVEKEVSDEPGVYASRFINSLRADRDPGLHYLHLLLPHSPFVYLPSGKRYTSRDQALVGLEGVDRWNREAWPVTQAHQAYLLQLQYTDRLLGAVLDRLADQRMYDRSTVVVVADHGVSFRPGEARREVNAGNAADILSVPLFVKTAGQRRGRTNDAFVRNTDVLATLADVLELRTPWPVAGTSAFRQSEAAAPTLDVYTRGGDRLTFGARQFERARNESLRRQVRLLGSGRRDLFAIGPHAGLVGTRAGRVATSRRAGVALVGDDRLQVDGSSAEVPAQVLGTVVGPDAGRVSDLALSVNGRIVTTTRTFTEAGAPRFTALLPEEALRDGSNQLRVYAVTRDGGRVRLTLLPS